MNVPGIVRRGWGSAALAWLSLTNPSPAQVPEPPARQPAADAPAPGPPGLPASEGPTHEAIQSRPKDLGPVFADKAPPAPINERPGVAPTGGRAVAIPGYWEWDPVTRDHAWVAGVWREPPPGRFWANGYWRREARGWHRVPGFWSDRPVDRIDWRKEGPPADHPADEPGPAPGPDRFYIPGRHAPDGRGLTWKQGFWTRVQPGWVWVPAEWVRQPEGWTVQEGFWDRPLEARGTRFAQVKPGTSAREGDTAYQPRAQADPGRPGRPDGSFIRPGPFAGDSSGRYRGFIGPGNLGPIAGQVVNSYNTPSGYLNQAQPAWNNNNPGYSSVPSAGSGFGGYPYYGHGLGSSPGYYGGSSYGAGLGYYPGYYGGSGTESGQQGIQQGGLGGYPYYGHGLGYYPGYFGGP